MRGEYSHPSYILRGNYYFKDRAIGPTITNTCRMAVTTSQKGMASHVINHLECRKDRNKGVVTVAAVTKGKGIPPPGVQGGADMRRDRRVRHRREIPVKGGVAYVLHIPNMSEQGHTSLYRLFSLCLAEHRRFFCELLRGQVG